jgi:hypothetical protein
MCSDAGCEALMREQRNICLIVPNSAEFPILLAIDIFQHLFTFIMVFWRALLFQRGIRIMQLPPAPPNVARRAAPCILACCYTFIAAVLTGMYSAEAASGQATQLPIFIEQHDSRERQGDQHRIPASSVTSDAVGNGPRSSAPRERSRTLYAKHFQYGISVGPSYSMLRGEDATGDFTYRLSFHASALGRYYFTLQNGIHLEAGYARRGAVLHASLETRTVRLDYIEIKPLFVTRLPLRRSIQPYIMAGPVLSLNVNASVIHDDTMKENLKLTDIRTFDPGLAVEAGMTLTTGSVQWIFGIGYTFHFQSVHDTGTLDLKNSGFTGRIGLLL